MGQNILSFFDDVFVYSLFWQSTTFSPRGTARLGAVYLETKVCIASYYTESTAALLLKRI